MIIRCSHCKLPTDGDYHSPDGFPFCSTECAIYGGRVNVNTGWINTGQPVRKGLPKKRWNMTDDDYSNLCKELEDV